MWGKIVTSRTFIFLFLVPWERLQSTPRSRDYNTCFGCKYFPSVSFRFKGQPPPFVAPEPILGAPPA